MIIEFGDTEEHGPLLLMWSAVTQLHSEMVASGNAANAGQLLARKLGSRALQLHSFEYLSSQLRVEPFNGKTVMFVISTSLKLLLHFGTMYSKY